MRVSSTIERRLLVNYRADPDVITPLLPQGYRPQIVNGWALVGICLIRLGDVRPRPLPAVVGITTENAAHRIAVERDTGPAVYIPRRDTDSALTVLLGGRVFAGSHHRGRFQVDESDDRVRVAYTSLDGRVTVDADVTVAAELNNSRIFRDLDHASAVFRGAPEGVSPRRDGELESVTLQTDAWSIEAADPVHVRSSFWDDTSRFPAGSVQLDSALLMRRVPVTWASQPFAAAAR